MCTDDVMVCECGAITVTIEGCNYSMPASDFREHYGRPPADAMRVGSCDYCVNNWGTDLCGCGSGEKFGDCEEGHSECGRPAQSIEEAVSSCYCDSGWL